MPINTFTIQFTLSALPDGFNSDYKAYAQLIADSLTGTVVGDFLNGTVGGSVPTENTGPHFNANGVQIWDETKAKYVFIGGPPIGAVFPWASSAAIPPANYLFCDGALLDIEDYPDLHAVLGNAFNYTTDANTSFRLPDLRGRLPVGSGRGLRTPGGTIGFLAERPTLGYTGAPNDRNIPTIPGAPAKRVRYKRDTFVAKPSTEMVDNMPPAVGFPFIIRVN